MSLVPKQVAIPRFRRREAVLPIGIAVYSARLLGSVTNILYRLVLCLTRSTTFGNRPLVPRVIVLLRATFIYGVPSNTNILPFLLSFRCVLSRVATVIPRCAPLLVSKILIRRRMLLRLWVATALNYRPWVSARSEKCETVVSRSPSGRVLLLSNILKVPRRTRVSKLQSRTSCRLQWASIVLLLFPLFAVCLIRTRLSNRPTLPTVL